MTMAHYMGHQGNLYCIGAMIVEPRMKFMSWSYRLKLTCFSMKRDLRLIPLNGIYN
jgi:hypothetical protein